MTVAVLFNSANVRLGWVSVSEDCRIIHFGGAYFARTETEVLVDGLPGSNAGPVLAYEQSYVYERRDLDVFKPTSGRDVRLAKAIGPNLARAIAP